MAKAQGSIPVELLDFIFYLFMIIVTCNQMAIIFQTLSPWQRGVWGGGGADVQSPVAWKKTST